MAPRIPPPSLDDTRSGFPDTNLDVSRLSFPVKLVISIIAALATVVLPILASFSSVRSDMRDMATRQEMRDDLNRQTAEALTQQLNRQAAKIEMLQVDVTDLKLALARSGGAK
jgi:hypothetical protein